MTDPVDTDALRALASTYRAEHWAPWMTTGDRDEWSQVEDAADEVDRLREANEEAESARSAAADYGDRLRAVIENAPHEERCESFDYLGRHDGEWVYKPCDCWKTDAL